MKITLLWDIAPCSLLEVYLYFRAECYLLQTTWHRIPENVTKLPEQPELGGLHKIIGMQILLPHI
jgi:hypothetical protein